MNLTAEHKEKIRASCIRSGVGKWMNGKTMSQEARIKISIARKGKKLSDATRQKISKANRGQRRSEETRIKISEAKKGSIAWNRGKRASEKANLNSSISHKKYYDKVGRADISRYHHLKDRFYIKWRTEVFLRDKFQCQICNQTGGTLNAHHIKSWTKYMELRYAIDNGITLCEKCHKEIHKKNENNLQPLS